MILERNKDICSFEGKKSPKEQKANFFISELILKARSVGQREQLTEGIRNTLNTFPLQL